MDNLVAWYIRGLNWPNKQVDVNIYLQLNKVGLIGLLETKVKLNNVEKVAAKVFPGWRWMHNFHLDPKRRIWVAWNPRYYQLRTVHMTVQFIHCEAIQVSTNTHFYITFVYGLNHHQQRQELWDDLHSYIQPNNPWCVIGDFNAILYKEDRIGGDDVMMANIREMREFMDSSELEELRSIGAYYSWSNKTVHSRIDRALANVYWHEVFNFAQVRYDTHSLSDHTPLLIQFPISPKEKFGFQFCDMCANHIQFDSIISATLPSSPYSMQKLKIYLDRLRPKLLKLNRTHFKDLREQQEIARCQLQQIQ